MIIFINGLEGFGSPPAGRPYWTEPLTPFVDLAMEYLRDSVAWIPAIQHDRLSHAEERKTLGYRYCQENLGNITSSLKTGETVKFIAHSMGCSFAEGMASFLTEHGYSVSILIHINAYQAGEMKANPQVPLTLDFQYTDDLMLRIPFVSHAGDIGDAVKIREKSHLWIRRRHRGPIYPRSQDFWQSIASFL